MQMAQKKPEGMAEVVVPSTPAVQAAAGRARRIYERRTTDTCVTQVGDDLYPVENWSEGGVLLGGDGKFLGLEQLCDLMIRFKLYDRVLNIKHRGRVVRKAGNKTAIQFSPLTNEIRNAFRQVIDDMVASEFANSQS